MQVQRLVPKTGKSSTTTVKVDKDDIRAKMHYLKTLDIDGKECRIWECGLCGKDFKYQYTLIRHIPTHTDVRNFHCNVCSKSFRQMSTLAQHKATHWDVRPFKCDICSKSFNRVSTLISHKKIHTDEKKHICDFCGKGFHQKGNLKNHMYTHTNERPYRCDMCDKGFNQKSNLVVHKNSTHLKKNEVNKPRLNMYHELPNPTSVNIPVDSESIVAGNPGVVIQMTRSTHKKTILKKENIENVLPTPRLSIDQPLIFINKKPSPEMMECFGKNMIPFVLYFKAGQNLPVICKAVMDGDHYVLMNPTYQDISQYKSPSTNSSTLIPLVNVINEHIQNEDIEYIVKPFKRSSPVQKSLNTEGQHSQSVVTEVTNIQVKESLNIKEKPPQQVISVTHQNKSGPSLKKEENAEKSFNLAPELDNIKAEKHEESFNNVLIMDNDSITSYYSSSSTYEDLDLDNTKLEESLLHGGNNFMDLLSDPLSDLI